MDNEVEVVDGIEELPESTVELDWDSDEYSPTPSTEATKAEAEADQAEAADEGATETEAESEQTATDEANAEAAGNDDFLELKHFDEIRKVNKDEAKGLAQKGMDYDRIRGKLDTANAEIAKLKGYENFLEELKGDFPTVQDLIADTKAALYIEEQKKIGNTITKASALEHVKEQLKDFPVPEEKEELQPSAEQVEMAIKRDSFTRFAEIYTDVKAADIPKEVWDDVDKTNSLVASYSRYQMKQINAELEALKLEEKNRKRSTGSMKSKGGNNLESIADSVWNDETW